MSSQTTSTPARTNLFEEGLQTLRVPAGQPLQTGKLYLRLFHGRHAPQESLTNWGFDGPVFGPLNHFQITYLTIFTFFGGAAEGELNTKDDLFYFEEKYYGDLSLFIAGDSAVL